MSGNTSLLVASEAYFGEAVFVTVLIYLFGVGMSGATLNVVVLKVFTSQKALHTPVNLVLISIAANDFGLSLLGTLWQFFMTVRRVEAMAGTKLCDIYGFTVYILGVQLTLRERYISLPPTKWQYLYTPLSVDHNQSFVPASII